jgi:integrase
MSAMTYLWRHPTSGVYYFRRAVPDALRLALGKTIVKKSLATKNVTEAKRRAHPLAIQTDAEFQAARSHQAAPIRTELSDREVASLVAAYHHELLAADDAARIDGSGEDDNLYKSIKAQVEAEGGAARFSDQEATAVVGLSPRAYQKRTETLEIVLPGLREKLARGDTGSVAFEVDVLLEIHGIKLDTGSASYRKLCFEFLRTAVRATEAMVQRHGGEVVDTPPAPAPLVIGSSPQPAPHGSDLQSMFDKWIAERKPSRKTVLDATTAVRRFNELHGNLPVHEITKSHVRAYKAALQRLPSALSGEMRQMTLPQLLQRLDATPAAEGTTLKAGSINKAVGALQTVFHWIGNQGYLDDHPNWSNPAADMKMHDPADEDGGRLPYDPEDLKMIFNSPVFRGGERPRAGASEAAKWLPLIALFSGARLEEIGQALVADVKVDEGIYYLDINTLDKQAGKRVKNLSSRRKLPLHPELLRCGLLDYVEAQRRGGDQRLFPELRPSVSGQVTGNWSKWWARYADGLGITDPRKVFHSFRHTFKLACRSARIEEERHDALTGHTSASVGRRYGGGVPLEVLAEEIAKVSYKGLDLSHLHVTPKVGSTELLGDGATQKTRGKPPQRTVVDLQMISWRADAQFN